jgi:hypothetical protein
MSALCISFRGVKRPGPGVNHQLPTGTQVKNEPYLYILAVPSWRYVEILTYWWCMSTLKACSGSFLPTLNTTYDLVGRVVGGSASEYQSVRKTQHAAVTIKSGIF